MEVPARETVRVHRDDQLRGLHDRRRYAVDADTKERIQRLRASPEVDEPAIRRPAWCVARSTGEVPFPLRNREVAHPDLILPGLIRPEGDQPPVGGDARLVFIRRRLQVRDRDAPRVRLDDEQVPSPARDLGREEEQGVREPLRGIDLGTEHRHSALRRAVVGRLDEEILGAFSPKQLRIEEEACAVG